MAAHCGASASTTATGFIPDGADLWAQLVHEAASSRWADLQDDQDVLQHALADSHDGSHVCEYADPQWGTLSVCPACSLHAKNAVWVDHGHWCTARHAKSVR